MIGYPRGTLYPAEKPFIDEKHCCRCSLLRYEQELDVFKDRNRNANNDTDLEVDQMEKEPLLRKDLHAETVKPIVLPPKASESNDAAAAGGAQIPLIGWHCHKAVDPSASIKLALRQLVAAMILTLIFMCGEFVGGILSNSLALITDATHLLSDFFSFTFSIIALYLAQRPANKYFSFGLLRADIMGAMVSIITIWVICAVLIFVAIHRITGNHFEVNSTQMLIVAGLGIVVNVTIGIVLHSEICLDGGFSQIPHHHGFGHSHHHSSSKPTSPPHQSHEQSNFLTAPTADTAGSVDLESKSSAARLKMKKNLNVRAAFIHVVGDTLQSIGVFISALVIHMNPKYRIADPICTLIFSVITLFTTITILVDVVMVIMEAVPRGIDYNGLRRELSALKDVKGVHGLVIWSLTIDKAAVNVHLAIDVNGDSRRVLRDAYKLLQSEYDYYHVNVQIEPYYSSTADCQQCARPKYE